jgi:DMSO/TMAO reductase YedYZ molybdopterin-dependent catalytic subunit
MTDPAKFLSQHAELSRRYFLQLGAAGVAAWGASSLKAEQPQADGPLAEAIAKLEYLSTPPNLRLGGRGKPPPYKLPPEKLREVGLVSETWTLEVIPDPESNAQVGQPLSKELGTALDWKDLLQLAEKHAVRFLHVLTCTNVADPYGMCLWEGVPLREVIWMTRPKANVRRVYYYGYHNDDPKQRFQSSLPLGRVLEDPPGELPVILAYKMNGEYLTPEAGAPVRMIVPGVYANKSIKWLQRVVLTNDFHANDTYANANNDVESPLKTQARFIHAPKEIQAGKAAALTGLAQVGMSGLSKVQYCVKAADQPWPEDDPQRSKADWQQATILPPPQDWGGGLPGGKLPPVPTQINPVTGQPYVWPTRYTIVHWAALLPGLPAGKYELCCRTIDANGLAQPMPRPLPKTGSNAIQQVTLNVKA